MFGWGNTLVSPNIWSAYKTWFTQGEPGFAFTGTAKQCLKSPDPNQSRRWCSVEDLSKNVSFFIERLSRDIFGRKLVRHGKRIFYSGVIEGNQSSSRLGGTRLHVHLSLRGISKDVDVDTLFHFANERWSNSLWGYERIHLTKIDSSDDDKRWTNYMFKEVSRSNTERLISNISFEK